MTDFRIYVQEKELKSWISSQLESGYTEKEIKDALVDENISRERTQRLISELNSGPKTEDLGYQPASLLQRILAQLLDNLIVGVMTAGIGLAGVVAITSFGIFGGAGINALLGGGEAGASAIAVILIGIFVLFYIGLVMFNLFGYKAWLETRNGKTWGMDAVGLKVISEDGEEVSRRQALIRAVTLGLSVFTGYLLTVIPILMGDTNKRIGDKIAGTQVVEE
jgi:uncharacterized RDD family membrane protein YckC